MIVVDAGHGGVDPGASGNGIIEKDLNLKISKYMYDRFKQLGIPVTMTRTTDETLTPDERVKKVLAAYGNKPSVIVISNHINAGGGDGAEVIYALRNKDTLSRMITEELAKEGQNIRKWYQRRLPTDPVKDYYFIHRETGVTEPVLVEYGFLDSTLDDVSQLKNNYAKYAEAVVRAVSKYSKLPYTYPDAGGKNYYTVVKGDSLWLIANKYNVTVDELKQANNLVSNTLTIGQQLLIPSSEQEYLVYTVLNGDSLWSIASKYNISVDDLKLANKLTSSFLAVGQQLIIPTVLPTPPPPANVYIVKSGDSLWTIANQYGITVEQLKAANNLTANLLTIGQELIIPTGTVVTPPSETNTYIVKSGDTLWTIARNFNITVDELKQANNLTSNLLNLGQELIIPVIGSTITYTVKSGDSLWTIANQFNTTTSELKQLNNLTSDLLSINQKIIVPIK